MNPPGIGTAVQLQADKNLFTNRPIATKYADERAGSLAKAVGGVIQTRPSQVQFALNELAGQPGKAVQAISEAAIKSHVPLTPNAFPASLGLGACSLAWSGTRPANCSTRPAKKS